MSQSTPDAAVPDSGELDTDFGEVPPELAWTLQHDLPGAGDVETPEPPPQWLASFPMVEAPPIEEPPERSWMPIAVSAVAAALVTLLVVWLLGGFDDGGTAAPADSADAASGPESAADVSGSALSAAEVGTKVTPSVVTIQVGEIAADGVFEGTTVGSGVVYSSDGFVVTNHHLVPGETGLRVVVADGTTYDAELVGSDASTDVAVLRIDAGDLTPIEVGQTEGLAIGEVAIAIGNPLGDAGGASLTVGVLSAFEREIFTVNSGTLFGMLQTDAPITDGVAGGALVDGDGRLIGLTTSLGNASSGTEVIGFAIPVEIVARIADEIIETGSVRHAFLGVRLEDYFEAADGGGSRPAGARVLSFPDGVDSAAAGAGLRIDDIVTAVDGAPMTTRDDLISALRRYRVGDTVTLDVVRDGQALTFDVVLGERPDDM